MSKDFLFVNRSTKPSSRPPNESQLIASHVQKSYQRKLRAQQVRARQSRTTARASLRSASSASVDFPEFITPSTSGSEHGDVDGRPIEERLQLTPPTSPYSSINEYLLSTLPIGRGAYDILQYFLNVDTWTLREVWREELCATTSTDAPQLSDERCFAIRPPGKLPGHKKEFNSALVQIIKGAFNSPVHMYALLTMTASGMGNTAGIPLEGKNTPEYLMSRVLPYLREEVARITNGELVDKQVLLDIFYLFAHEWWVKSYANALTHLRIIHSLLHTLDKDLPLDRYIFEGAIFDDVMICLESGTRPLRAKLDWAPLDLSTSEQAEIKSELKERQLSLLKDLGMSSAAPNLDGRKPTSIFLVPLKTDERITPMIVLSPLMGVGLLNTAKTMGNPSMELLVCEILWLIEVMQYTWISIAPAPKYTQWATAKVHAILHRLLSMDLKGEWECVRLSIVMMLSVLLSNRAPRSGAMNARRLRAALTNQPNHLQVTESLSEVDAGIEVLMSFADQRMLFWVLNVGAANAASSPDRGWFIKQATKIAKGLSLRTVEQLSEVIVHYLCLLRSQQTVIEEVGEALYTKQRLLSIRIATAP